MVLVTRHERRHCNCVRSDILIRPPCVDKAIDPLVWQAVVIKDTPPRQLVLIPHSEVLSCSCEKSEAFKRPRHFHPALQTKAAAKLLSDEKKALQVFELRSPLLGTGGLSPPAYWAVLAVEGVGNMCFRECVVPVEHPALRVKGDRKRLFPKASVQAIAYVLFVCSICRKVYAIQLNSL